MRCVRMPLINQQDFKYSLYSEKTTEYKKDADGNVIYVIVNGKQHPIEKEVPAHYTNPIDFKASISMSGGEAEAVEFGVDISSYSAVITVPKGMLPITETSLIWFQTEPEFDSKTGYVKESSADYTVVKVSSSILYTRYILAKKVNN